MNVYQLGIDAANMDVVNSYLDEGNTIPAVLSIQGDEDQTSIGHMEKSDEDSSTEKSTDFDTAIAMSSECSAASSSGSTDFVNSTSDSDSHAQKIKSPAKSKVAKIGQKRTYAFSSTQIG